MNELVPIGSRPNLEGVATQICAVTPLPAVSPDDMFAALLADARKPMTRRAREQDALDFARFVKAVDPTMGCSMLVSMTAGHANAVVTAYVRSMLDRRLAASTINRRVSTLKRLVSLARKFELANWSIDCDRFPDEALRDTAGPGQSGWVRILECAEASAKKSPVGKRDLAMIRLMHDHGLRRQELAGVDLVDLDTDSGRLWILGKGRNAKEAIRLNMPTLLALEHYLDARGTAAGPLFVRLDRARDRQQLERLGADGVHKAVTSLGRRAGLTRLVRPHGLRHAGVTRVLELNNGNIDAAQRFARHKDPRTTQRYNDNRRDVAGDMARLLGDDA